MLAALRRFVRLLLGRTIHNVKEEGTAFGRLASHIDAFQVARGKVFALRAAVVQHKHKLDELEADAVKAHDDLTEVGSRLQSISSRL